MVCAFEVLLFLSFSWLKQFLITNLSEFLANGITRSRDMHFLHIPQLVLCLICHQSRSPYALVCLLPVDLGMATRYHFLLDIRTANKQLSYGAVITIRW